MRTATSRSPAPRLGLLACMLVSYRPLARLITNQLLLANCGSWRCARVVDLDKLSSFARLWLLRARKDQG